MKQFYILRHFDYVPLSYNKDEDNVYGKVVKGFESKTDLLNYCKEHEIILNLEYDISDSESNYAKDTTVLNGYDYIICDLDELIDHIHQIKGKSFTE
jgi:hypothetical protein